MTSRTTRALLAAAGAALMAACGNGDMRAAPSDQPAQAAPAAPAAAPQQAAAPAQAATAQKVANGEEIVVYKSPTCGCCGKWVEHMQASGFKVTVHDTASVDPVKQQAKVPQSAWSCHTGLIGGYAIEGHVPADLVARLIREKPADLVGLAVPGMVTGSPGMEGPDPQHYDVVALHKDGTTSVYASR